MALSGVLRLRSKGALMADPLLFGRQWTQRELREHVSDMSQVRLSSAISPRRAAGWPAGRADPGRCCPQLASIQRSTLAEGKARGSERVQLWLADGFALSLEAGRCLDVGAASWRGVPLASITPPRTVGAAFVEEGSPSGFARSFGAGLVFTCGLSSIGGPVPGPDEPGGEEDGPVPTHGRISMSPAEGVSTSAEWEEGVGYVLRAKAVMREATAFGTNLQEL